MRPQLAALLVGLFMVPAALVGQTVPAGSRVRVTDPREGTRVGTVVQLAADTLAISFDGRADDAYLPLRQVTRLDVFRGTEQHILSRTGLGLLIGAGVGAAVGAAGDDGCGSRSGEFCMGEGFGATVGAVLLGGLGGVIGFLLGLAPSDKWERVPLEQSRVGIITPRRGHGGGVGIALAF